MVEKKLRSCDSMIALVFIDIRWMVIWTVHANVFHKGDQHSFCFHDNNLTASIMIHDYDDTIPKKVNFHTGTGSWSWWYHKKVNFHTGRGSGHVTALGRRGEMGALGVNNPSAQNTTRPLCHHHHHHHFHRHRHGFHGLILIFKIRRTTQKASLSLWWASQRPW